MSQPLYIQALPLKARVWARALDLVFPPRCVGCREYGAFLCARCLGAAERAVPARCGRCWARLDTHELCSDCRRWKPAFKGVRSAFVYEGAAREAVHALKYRGLSAIAGPMAGLMAEALVAWAPPVRAVAPVPSAGGRRRSRGYNQAELLAREVSRLTGLPLERHALRRVQAGPAQVSMPTPDRRWLNVAAAFAPGREGLQGPLLVVDDVITTGATLHACTLAAGVPVYGLTFARDG